MPLTDVICRNAKPRAKAYKLSDGKGLYLEVMPHGSRLWRMKYRYAGKEKRLALGIYDEVSLKEAREKCDAARKQLSDGIDPSFAKQEQKRAILLNAENTFEAVAREWHQHNLEKWSENHANTVMRRLEADIFPKIGKLPIKDITASILLPSIRAIEKRSAFEMARRSLQYCTQIFSYANIVSDHKTNPARDLSEGKALKPFKRGHYAAMEAKDLPDFLIKLSHNEGRLFPQTRMAIELIMLTFVRTSELIEAKWKEFDFKECIWIVPAERMKMRKPHIIPLSKQVLSILHRLKEYSEHREYIFPSQRDPRSHMSNNTILVALDRMGYRGQHTGHGFRALAMSTIKEKLGYRHEVIDRQLAHAHKSQIDAAYDRAKFLDERKKMMQDWADYLDKIATGDKAAA